MNLKKFQVKSLLMERNETLSFSADRDKFRLEVQRDTYGRTRLTLFQNDRAVKKPLSPTLELLRYMAERPDTELLENEILDALWPTADPGILATHVSALRKLLANDDPKNPKYVKTIPKRGYKFLPEVAREGDLEGVDVFPIWNRARFYKLMSEVKRGSEEEESDLRIIATGISSSLDELDLPGLLRRHVRVRILFMNPANEALTRARYGLRKDKTMARCLEQLEQQIEDIQKIAAQYPPQKVHRGSIEFGVSDAMPSGFVVHTKDWALLGVFPAHDSYTAAPMLEIRSHSPAWETLKLDWNERWKDFEDKRKTQKPRKG